MDRLYSLIVLALGAHYVNYVVTESAIFAGLRSLLAKRLPFLAKLAGCYNCMAFWSGAFVVLLWYMGDYWLGGQYFVVVCAVASMGQFLMQWRWKSEP